MAKRIKYLIWPLVIACGVFFLLELGFIPGLTNKKQDPYEPFRRLSTVIQLVKNDYVEVPDPAKTMEGALKGLVDSLDVLSCYLSPAQVELYRKNQTSDLMKTGIVLYKAYGTFPVVIAVMENSPAAALSISLGDAIGEIDGTSTLGMSMVEANLLLKHAGARPVEIKIVRAQENEYVSIGRKKLQEAPFSFTSEEGTLGILRIHSFFAPLARRIKEDLPGLIGKSQGRPLVIDLRGCYEGLFSESIRFLDLFIKESDIGYLERRKEIKEKVACPETPLFAELPLIIWTDPATLGPAEVVLSTLKHFRQARIIGHKTLGLAANQTLFLLDDGSGVLLTDGVFNPKGTEKLWLTGISPDTMLERNQVDRDAYLKATRDPLPD